MILSNVLFKSEIIVIDIKMLLIHELFPDFTERFAFVVIVILSKYP